MPCYCRLWLGLVVASVFGATGCSLGLFQDPPNEDAGDVADEGGDVEVGADGDADGDAADADVPPECGNGEWNPDDEECDDGNDVEGDGCDNDCTWSCSLDVHCRDTEICNGAETCDTASHTCAAGVQLANGYPCSLPGGGAGECRLGVCRSLTCGDGTTDEGEDCDDGNENDNDRCPSTCFDARCGDEFVWDEDGGVEECDDGNDVEGDGCDGDCTWSCDGREDCDDEEPCNGVETCTDHVCELLSPALEEGAPCTTSSGAAGNCSAAMCMPENCGNGSLDAGEECDDGNETPGDGCEPNCTQSCHADDNCREGPDNPCTDDSCEPPDSHGARECRRVDNSRPCDDSDPCTGLGTCSGGSCVVGAMIDGDGDTYGPGASCGGDCSDADPAVHPGAAEGCNATDDDCDGGLDEGLWCPSGNVGGNVLLNDVWVDATEGIGFAVGHDVITGHAIIGRWFPATAGWGVVLDDDVSSRELHGVWGFGTANAWAAGTVGLLYRFDGTVWTQIPTGSVPWGSFDMYGMWGANSNAVWVVGMQGEAHTWNGSSWVNNSPGAVLGMNNLNGVCGTGVSSVWAVGLRGKIGFYDGSWSDQSIPTFTGELNECWALAPDNVWAVGIDGSLGAILHRGPGGWTVLPTVTSHTLWGVWGSSTTPTWAVGNTGLILRDDPGLGWTSDPSPTGIGLTAIHGRGGSAPLAFAVDRNGDIFGWHP